MAPDPPPPQLLFSGNPDEALIRWPCFSDIAHRLRVRFENGGAPLSYAEAVETLMIVAPLLAVDKKGSSHVVQLAAMAVVGDFHDGQFEFWPEKIGFVLGRWYGGLETLHSATASADAKRAVKKELFEAQAALQFVVQRVRTPDRDLLPIVRCRAALEQHSAANPFRRDDPRTLDCRNLFIVECLNRLEHCGLGVTSPRENCLADAMAKAFKLTYASCVQAWGNMPNRADKWTRQRSVPCPQCGQLMPKNREVDYDTVCSDCERKEV